MLSTSDEQHELALGMGARAFMQKASNDKEFRSQLERTLDACKNTSAESSLRTSISPVRCIVSGQNKKNIRTHRL